jgi:phosphatidylglycerol:prolipoprotein diacylglycerol transferase
VGVSFKMLPDLFSIGLLTIHTYGIFVALGFTAAILVTIKLGESQGFPAQQVVDMAFIMIVWAIVGSRAMYVLINLSFFITHPLDTMKIWQGGLVFSGGFLAVTPVMAWHLRRRHLSFWKVGDLWAPAIALGQGIGRIGCFMAGCCYGKPTDLPWGVVFKNPNSLAPLGIPLHPTQVYDVLAGIVIFLILLIITSRKKFEGQVFVWFLILHSTARLLTERFRGDDRGMIPWAEMTATQLLAVLILLSAVIALFLLKSRHEKESRVA